MASVVLEKRTLELRRSVSRQYYQTDLLIELHVRLRLETQRLTAPSQLAVVPLEISSAEGTKRSQGDRKNSALLAPPRSTESKNSERLPLLRFQQPFDPDGGN